MRFTILYARSRLVPRALQIIGTIATGTWLLELVVQQLHFHVNVLPLAAPAACAMTIVTSTRSPFADAEYATSRPLLTLRAGHIIALLGAACGALAIATTAAHIPGGIASDVRNTAGLTGMSLITARLVGTNLFWPVPFAYVVYCGAILDAGAADLWSWPAIDPTSTAAAITALCLLAGGLAVSANPRARAVAPLE
jgi:hypothetical protein